MGKQAVGSGQWADGQMSRWADGQHGVDGVDGITELVYSVVGGDRIERGMFCSSADSRRTEAASQMQS